MLVFIRNLLLLPLTCSFQYSKISCLCFLWEHVINVFLISANLNLLAQANKESLQNVMEHKYISDTICLLFFSIFGSLAWSKLISSISPKLLSVFSHSSNGFTLVSLVMKFKNNQYIHGLLLQFATKLSCKQDIGTYAWLNCFEHNARRTASRFTSHI